MDGKFRYVYTLQSIEHPEHDYVGMSEDLHKRLKAHNAGRCPHTSKFAPWRIETVVAFREKGKAIAFEQYVKSHSGRAFGAKRL